MQLEEKIKQITDKYIEQAVHLILMKLGERVSAESGKAHKPDGRKKPITPKPCPVCGTLNKNRRFRFYCSEHKAQSGAKY